VSVTVRIGLEHTERFQKTVER